MYTVSLNPYGIKIENINLKNTVKKDYKKIIDLLDTYQLVIIPNQILTPKEWIEICKHIGKVTKYKYFTHPQHPEIVLIKPDGMLGSGEIGWHTNGMARQSPENGLGVYCVEPGTNSITSFVNCHLAYKQLPDHKKTYYNKLKVDFKYENNRYVYASGKQKETLTQMGTGCMKPLCIESPVSEKKAMYFGINYINKLIGVSTDLQEQLMKELSKYIFQEKYIYHHSWSKGDCLFADQYLTQHKRNSVTGKRLLYRTVFYYGSNN
ncbi:MAG: TauD/TfdA family dioxygenase [Oligoflexia bacterium]|nr:TauD/TfdA family dioxygenase [Oligoflexia bacterium]